MYNKRQIMSTAWEIRKSANVDMATALRAAWALVKAIKKANEIGEESGWNHKTSVSDWVKYGKNRTYVSARIYTNAWHLKKEERIGYVDNMTGVFYAN